MSFIDRIKRDLFDVRNRRGQVNSRVTVNERDLIMLIEHFESLDAEDRSRRSQSERQISVHERLNLNIRELWATSGKNADEILLVFADVVGKLVKEKLSQIPLKENQS